MGEERTIMKIKRNYEISSQNAIKQKDSTGGSKPAIFKVSVPSER